MKYDLIVVGAGPAGTIAAITAKNRGLNVALIERRKLGSKLKRANTCMLVDTPGFNGENVSLQETRGNTKIVFEKNSFDISVPGTFEKIYDSISYSPNGKKIHVHNTKKSLYHLFDNQIILDTLAERALRAGVSVMDESLAVSGENTETGVSVKVKHDSGETILEGSMAVVAEGLKSSLAKSTGAMKERVVFGRGPSLQYTMENVKFPFENRAFVTFYGSTYSRGGGVLYVAPCSGGNDRYYVGISGVNPGKYCKIFLDEFFGKDLVADWFRDARIVDYTGAVVHLITPMADPIKGRFMFAGDSAGFAETMYQGAMMCGYRAASAAADELDGKKGCDSYRDFWKNSFLWNKNPQSMADYLKIGFFYPFFSDAELDYLFGLVDGRTFEGIHDPYQQVNKLFELILTSENIKPEMAEKASMFRKITMQDIAKLIEQKRQFAKKE
ncbi:MAG: NAD(P)/FAD-dependent oxidoreductase [Candidatus Schekmanbacteria bacterium]|nr:NAD(P)/FAD-dependent oxidoreductase [Candidatus Schekmanbacteria bacterium]